MGFGWQKTFCRCWGLAHRLINAKSCGLNLNLQQSVEGTMKFGFLAGFSVLDQTRAPSILQLQRSSLALLLVRSHRSTCETTGGWTPRATRGVRCWWARRRRCFVSVCLCLSGSGKPTWRGVPLPAQSWTRAAAKRSRKPATATCHVNSSEFQRNEGWKGQELRQGRWVQFIYLPWNPPKNRLFYSPVSAAGFQ